MSDDVRLYSREEWMDGHNDDGLVREVEHQHEETEDQDCDCEEES